MTMQARRDSESGQSLVLLAVVLLVLCGFCALLLDSGNAYMQRRQMQGTADAAAMAGIQKIASSRASAEADASEYATTRNSSAGAVIHTLVSTGAGSSSCNGQTVPPYSLCIRLQHSQTSLFGGFTRSGSTVRAQAIATASQVKSMSGWLPFGVMGNKMVSGQQEAFRPGSVAALGSINTPAGDSCKFYGGNEVRDVILSKANGGADACPIDVGQQIETQTGVTSGIIKQGFDGRVGSNTDSFSDVFELDATTGKYRIKKPNSPRLGIIPIAGGNGNWPLSGGQAMTVAGYAFVYIGDRDTSGYPPTSGSGNGLKIYLTPVDAILPSDSNTPFQNYDPNSPHNITAYRLIG